jgi:N-acetylmuramoyl-L-alanine amidase
VIAEAVLCAALVVYGEARGEPYIGREAVVHVLVNRVKLNKTTICWETFKPGQFAGVEGRSQLPRGHAWADAIAVSRRVIEGGAADFTGGATHFDNIEEFGLPRWAGAKQVTGKWGNHTFFRARPESVYNGTSRAKRVKTIQRLKEGTMRK